MNRILAIALCVVISDYVSAEDFVKFPTGPASWSVLCKQKGTSAPASEEPADQNGKKAAILQKIEVAQSADARRTILRWSNGQSRELWSLPKSNIIITEDPRGTAFTTRNELTFGDPFGPSSFNWITMATKKGETTVKVNGIDCNHYAGIVRVPGEVQGTIAVTISCEAWIDAATLLPVALFKGNAIGTFSFGIPPVNLEMPGKFKETLDYYKMTQGG